MKMQIKHARAEQVYGQAALKSGSIITLYRPCCTEDPYVSRETSALQFGRWEQGTGVKRNISLKCFT